MCYCANNLGAELRVDIQDDDPYFADLRARYGQGLLDPFAALPAPAGLASAAAAAD